MSVNMSLLTSDQQEVYDLCKRGRSIAQIAKKLNKPERIITAQMTRIRSKGFDLSPTPVDVDLPSADAVFNQPRPNTPTPVSYSDVGEIIDKAAQAGPAVYNIAEAVERVKHDFSPSIASDIHPMVLFGIAVQFMRMAGGRLQAHQLIEDVYGTVSDLSTGPSPVVAEQGSNESQELLSKIKQLLDNGVTT